MDEFVGKTFGMLTVIERTHDYVSPSGGKHKKYICYCKCGNIVSVLKEHLTSGRQKSCNCMKKNNGIVKHREIHTRLYRVWGNMCNRCTNENNPAWNNYGGRGIKVCQEWLNYENFRDWARESGYSDNVTIDRINNDDGYYPSNCRWVDTITQANNKRVNHLIEYNGCTKTIAEWARYLNVSYKALHNRIVRLGWTAERALTQPFRKSPVRNIMPNKEDG